MTNTTPTFRIFRGERWALHIRNTGVSLDRRQMYEYHLFHLSDAVHGPSGSDLMSGPGDAIVWRKAARSLLSFLSAHAESERPDGAEPSENADLFTCAPSVSADIVDDLYPVIGNDGGWWDDNRITDLQLLRVWQLAWSFGKTIDLNDVAHIICPFDLPAGWLQISTGGVTFGIDPDGGAHS